MARMLPWPNDRKQIEYWICSTVAPLKIGLKTKDDFLFLQEWVEHHARIVGEESIFIADNGSVDPRVLDYYDSISDDICIFSFQGLHNDLHDRYMFPELHRSLLLSSDYFQILDTDERLIWIDRSSYIADQRLVEKLILLNPMEAAFGIWLDNLGGERDKFLIGPQRVLLNSIQWGKSLFSAGRMMPKGHKLHNCQLPLSIQSTFDYTPHICILHLKNLSSEQRLQSARNKLIARRAISPSLSFDEIFASTVLPNALPGSDHYHEQFKKLFRGEVGWEYSEEARRGTLTLQADGFISFSSITAEESFNSLFDAPAEVARLAFSQYVNLAPK